MFISPCYIILFSSLLLGCLLHNDCVRQTFKIFQVVITYIKSLKIVYFRLFLITCSEVSISIATYNTNFNVETNHNKECYHTLLKVDNFTQAFQ